MKDAIAELLVKNIRTDGGTQMRAEIDDDTVDDYVAALESLPPVTVFYDGKTYWLADGFHRLRAHEKAGKKVVYAEVKSGTQRDAILHAVGTNAMHGRRRTNADKRRAVETLLRDPEWATWSDREIARRCSVSNQFVSNVRPPSVNGGQMRESRRGDTSYPMDVSNLTSRQLATLPEGERIKIRQAEERKAEELAEARQREEDEERTQTAAKQQACSHDVCRCLECGKKVRGAVNS